VSIVLAFTGTRRGLTDAQRSALRVVLAGYPGATLHNGCAEGADEECLELVYSGILGRCSVVLHPAHLLRFIWAQSWQVGFNGHADLRGVAGPLERNRRMVDAASVVIACPHGPEERRSGTWSTVRYARKRGRDVVIVWPDGRIEREGGGAG